MAVSRDGQCIWLRRGHIVKPNDIAGVCGVCGGVATPYVCSFGAGGGSDDASRREIW